MLACLKDVSSLQNHSYICVEEQLLSSSPIPRIHVSRIFKSHRNELKAVLHYLQNTVYDYGRLYIVILFQLATCQTKTIILQMGIIETNLYLHFIRCSCMKNVFAGSRRFVPFSHENIWFMFVRQVKPSTMSMHYMNGVYWIRKKERG